MATTPLDTPVVTIGSLVPEDGPDGGLLLVVPRAHLDVLRDAVVALGLEVRMWGNGRLEPEGWAWSYGH